MSRLTDAHLAVFNARVDRLNASDALIAAQIELMLGRLEARYGTKPGASAVALPDKPNVKTLMTSTLRTIVRR